MNDEPIMTPEEITPEAPVETNALQQERDEYLAGWKRAQADYLNLKKDTDREKQEFGKYANERLLEELLPAIEQFDLAISYAPDLETLPEEEKKRIGNWLNGIRAVRSLWMNTFQSIGLEPVTTEGVFDPQMHEAVGEEVSEGIEAGSIVRTMQGGWKLNGKLLRPAKVIISSQTN
jgi:molecular chaperone GrpE